MISREVRPAFVTLGSVHEPRISHSDRGGFSFSMWETQKNIRNAQQESDLSLNRREWKSVRLKLHLSERELEVVQSVFVGRTLAQISDEMRLALGTVKTYVQRIYRKVQVSSQQELTLRVIDAHLRNRNQV